MNKRVGIIMVAHGSKIAQSNEEFMALVEKVKLEKAVEFDDFQYAFLEFEDPSIETAIEAMCAQDIDEIYIYPYFLNSGKHVLVDIPNAISAMQERCEKVKIVLTPHFGGSYYVASIISNDLKMSCSQGVIDAQQ